MKHSGAKLILSGTRQNILSNLASELGNDVKTIATDLNSRDDILNRIKGLRKSVDTNRVPNVYVLDGIYR